MPSRPCPRGVLTLTNADWTAPDGRPGLRIVLADTGPGLAKALIGELFKPFVICKQNGTGLGQWISRSIIERYGGDIVARNRPAEQGSGAVSVDLGHWPFISRCRVSGFR